MAENSLTQSALAGVIQRDQSYVSERVSGKRPFTTDDIDAIAQMIGVDGRTLLLHVAELVADDPDIESREDEEVSGVPRINAGESLANAAHRRKKPREARNILSDSD